MGGEEPNLHPRTHSSDWRPKPEVWKAAGPSLRWHHKPQNRPEIGVEETHDRWIKEPRKDKDRETGCKWRREWAAGVRDAQAAVPLGRELPRPLRRKEDAVTGT